MEIFNNVFLQKLVELGVQTQRTAWNNGDENQGASIDIMSYLLKKYDTRRYSTKGGLVSTMVSDIKLWDSTNGEALKYAKPISQITQRVLASAVTAETKNQGE